MSFDEELVRRAQEYTVRHQIALGESLGSGVHGIVFATESQPQSGLVAVRSAIKVHRRELDYCRERDVYLRLRDRGVTSVRGGHVPRLLRSADDLWVIEMTIVTRPFVLDFAGAYLDHAPDFSEEVVADWRTEKEEQFGRHWPEVQAILRTLEGYGVFMIDVNPGNIAFAD